MATFAKLATSFIVAVLCLFATSVVEAGCKARWETRQEPGGRPYQVRVADPECARALGRTGDGVYNGRRKTGIIVGAILGGGIAHALGGDPGQVVSGVLGGAQTGTYIGSTFDEDARVRDQIEHNRARCGTGTYYNTVSHTCEVDQVPQAGQQDTSPQSSQGGHGNEPLSFKTVAEAHAYCASLAPGGFFEDGNCVAPRASSEAPEPEQRMVSDTLPTPTSAHHQFCLQDSRQTVRSCPSGQQWLPFYNVERQKFQCGCTGASA